MVLCMTKNSAWLTIDSEHVAGTLQDAEAKLGSADGEVVLDFRLVPRIGTDAVAALEKLAGAADAKAVKLVLHGVNVDVYRVLKVLKLAPRFSFLT